MILVLAACVPATTPPQLAATPGPSVVVAGQRYDAGDFQARYPAGWRVITSPAGAAPFVFFVAPDNCALIALSASPLELPQPSGCADAPLSQATLVVNGDGLNAGVIASESQWDAALAAFEQVVASVEQHRDSR